MAAEINVEQLFALVKEIKGKDESRSKWYIGPLVTVLIAAMGVFISWGMMMKTTEYLQDQVDRTTTQFSIQAVEISQLKIAQAKGDTMLTTIKDDVKDIKDNVNKLMRRKGL